MKRLFLLLILVPVVFTGCSKKSTNSQNVNGNTTLFQNYTQSDWGLTPGVSYRTSDNMIILTVTSPLQRNPINGCNYYDAKSGEGYAYILRNFDMRSYKSATITFTPGGVVSPQASSDGTSWIPVSGGSLNNFTGWAEHMQIRFYLYAEVYAQDCCDPAYNIPCTNTRTAYFNNVVITAER